MRDKRFLIADIACGVLAVCLWLILACACQINIRETPVNGEYRGSSYVATAIGNPDWVARHPRLAQTIKSSAVISAFDGIMMLPSFLLAVTGVYLIPFVLIAYLVWRIWSNRKTLVRATPLALVAIVILLTFPVLSDCITVMMD